MKDKDFPAPDLVLPPGLLAEVRRVLREGESVADFAEAAVRQLLRSRGGPPLSPDGAVAAPVGETKPVHAADELLAQLDSWLQGGRPGAASG